MLSPLAASGEVLAITVLAIGVAGFLQSYARTRYPCHLAMLPPVVLVLGSSLILFSGYPDGDPGRAASFLLIQSFGFPFFLYWGEKNRRRMEEIATTGDFDPGFPLPSENHIMISFFGQIYEDLAKPIVAIEGEQKLNSVLDRVSLTNPVLARAHFTKRGELKLDMETILRIGGSRLDPEPLVRFLDGLVEHFASAGNVQHRKDLATALRARCGGTVNRYRDFLIDEGLFFRLAGGLLTDRTSTGLVSLDKALGGGLPNGVAVLVLGSPIGERERMALAFIRAGMRNGDGCLVVSATRSPDQIATDLKVKGMPGELKLVDCYTARFKEIPALETRGDTIISPVDPSVVNVAISRALDSMGTERKRALVDVLSAYTASSPTEKIYPFMLEMIHLLRSRDCTSLFVFNPPESEGQTGPLIFEELFDCVLKMRKERNEQVVLDFEKLGARLTPKAEAPGESFLIIDQSSRMGISIRIAGEVL